MGPLGNIIGQYLGRIAVRLASKDILKKYGLAATKKFFNDLTPEVLQTATRKELIELAKNNIGQQANRLLSDEVFSKSNAKKLASVLNKTTDYIENKTKEAIIKGYTNLNNRKLADTLKTLSTPGLGTPGREGIDVLGIEVGGKFIAGKVRSSAATKTRDAALELLRLSVVPQNKSEAFAVAFARGFLGEATGTAVNSLLLGTPRSVLAAPKARAFYNTLKAEVEFLRVSGQIKSASQLNKAINKAFAGARDVYGTQEGLVSTQIAGYISGRLSVPLAANYVFVDQDERKRNIEKFQQSIKPFAKQKVRTYVDSYVRSDGTKVKGHYRDLVVA